MTLEESIKARHSVRQYQNKPLDKETITVLQAEIEACNREGDLYIQLVTNDRRRLTDSWHITESSAVSPVISQ